MLLRSPTVRYIRFSIYAMSFLLSCLFAGHSSRADDAATTAETTQFFPPLLAVFAHQDPNGMGLSQASPQQQQALSDTAKALKVSPAIILAAVESAFQHMEETKKPGPAMLSNINADEFEGLVRQFVRLAERSRQSLLQIHYPDRETSTAVTRLLGFYDQGPLKYIPHDKAAHTLSARIDRRVKPATDAWAEAFFASLKDAFSNPAEAAKGYAHAAQTIEPIDSNQAALMWLWAAEGWHMANANQKALDAADRALGLKMSIELRANVLTAKALILDDIKGREVAYITYKDAFAAHKEIARDFGESDKWPQAEAKYREVYDLSLVYYGHHHQAISSALNDIALALYQQGRFAEAATILEKSIALLREIRGPDHADTIGISQNLDFVRAQIH